MMFKRTKTKIGNPLSRLSGIDPLYNQAYGLVSFQVTNNQRFFNSGGELGNRTLQPAHHRLTP